ncbi:Pkinase-domain-containing protein [Hypoxylon sp. FL1284]|nr:Pkinase-domain-containing protein [Hypoxylon sp. FL1284]
MTTPIGIDGQQPQGSSSDAPEHTEPEHTDGAVMPHERATSVRFSSVVDEIDPPAASYGSPESRKDSVATPDALRALTNSLQGAQLQEQRLKNYSFDPVSLPPSRVASNETTPGATPQHSNSPMSHPSPRLSPKPPELASPPLTPAGTSAADHAQRGAKSARISGSDGGFDSQAITPQASGQEDSRPVSPRVVLPHRPASTDNISQRSTAVTEQDGKVPSHRKGMFSIGPGGQSVPVSRESSPSRNAASQYYSRPFTPQGDVNDPYAASKRPTQSRNSTSIDQRFVFSRKKKTNSPSSSSTNVSKTDKQEKRASSLFAQRNRSGDLQPTGTGSTMHSSHGSMSDLKRFFKVGVNHKPKKSTTPSPLSSKPAYQVPFADDHGLSSKYGKLGRVLGSGAGGSVKLMKRTEDNTVFAVKEFRPRHSYETEKEYVKKLTAEFCIGSALHHGNIIETLDIVQEKGKWYEVMEYAPFDLFAIVMTGKMSKPEITCCFLQILSGVTYLHSSGLAHRDLKLDNVVVSRHGIMKIIDFGSAHVFRYPFETELVLATGVVGSDPYLAPEVYDERKYDPQAVDIWSLAIIFCCMSLRRFPWKVPRVSDNSYKLFASEPSPGHDPKKLILPSRSTNDLVGIPQRDIFTEESAKQQKAKSTEALTPGAADSNGAEKKEVIRGPWRLLRLLPRESRHIIGRMLTIDPRRRAQMAEILEEPWVSDTVICRQMGHGEVIKAEDHTHVLEPPAPANNK